MKTQILAGMAVMLCTITGLRARAEDNATNAIRNFMQALYSNDKAAYDSTILPDPASDILLGKDALSEEALAKVKADVSRMRLIQTDPFTLKGRKTEPIAAGAYPIDTKTAFMTQFRGVNLAIPLLMTADGWKVDTRYWTAAQKEYAETDPEVVARKFLYFLIGHNTQELQQVSTAGATLDSLLVAPIPTEDQYYALVEEMPVVAARPGETMELPDKRIIKADSSTTEHAWVIGMYGPYELLFELKKEGDDWKVVPEDYLSLLGIGTVDSSRHLESEPRLGL